MIFIDPKLWAVASETPIGNVDVGDIVRLRENLVPVDYIVVHQGLPRSMYDASCNGTWLLRKDIAEERKWNDTNVNDYGNSTINSYLNSTYLNRFDPNVQGAIKQVKIPFVNGTGGSPVASGANGLSCKIFLLSGYEVGFSQSDNQYFPQDGAKLSYFEAGTGFSANNKRIAKLNGSSAFWWLRSPNTDTSTLSCLVDGGGLDFEDSCTYSHGIRPAFILPSTFPI